MVGVDEPIEHHREALGAQSRRLRDRNANTIASLRNKDIISPSGIGVGQGVGLPGNGFAQNKIDREVERTARAASVISAANIRSIWTRALACNIRYPARAGADPLADHGADRRDRGGDAQPGAKRRHRRGHAHIAQSTARGRALGPPVMVWARSIQRGSVRRKPSRKLDATGKIDNQRRHPDLRGHAVAQPQAPTTARWQTPGSPGSSPRIGNSQRRAGRNSAMTTALCMPSTVPSAKPIGSRPA